MLFPFIAPLGGYFPLSGENSSGFAVPIFGHGKREVDDRDY